MLSLIIEIDYHIIERTRSSIFTFVRHEIYEPDVC